MSLASHPRSILHHESRDLPWNAEAPRAARAFVRQVLAGWGCIDAEDAYSLTLVVSELVTNVVQHANSPDHPLAVALHLMDGRTVRIAVADGSAVDPVVRDLNDTATSGRGLQLVSALADRWGVERRAHGKSVWVEVDLSRTG